MCHVYPHTVGEAIESRVANAKRLTTCWGGWSGTPTRTVFLGQVERSARTAETPSDTISTICFLEKSSAGPKRSGCPRARARASQNNNIQNQIRDLAGRAQRSLCREVGPPCKVGPYCRHASLAPASQGFCGMIASSGYRLQLERDRRYDRWPRLCRVYSLEAIGGIVYVPLLIWIVC